MTSGQMAVSRKLAREQLYYPENRGREEGEGRDAWKGGGGLGERMEFERGVGANEGKPRNDKR